LRRLLTTRQVAALLGLSPETVLRRHRAGELPGIRLASNVLRFDEDDVRAYIEARRTTSLRGSACATMRETVGCSAAEGEADPV
jgi:excisionase family DNA binding protein